MATCVCMRTCACVCVCVYVYLCVDTRAARLVRPPIPGLPGTRATTAWPHCPRLCVDTWIEGYSLVGGVEMLLHASGEVHDSLRRGPKQPQQREITSLSVCLSVCLSCELGGARLASLGTSSLMTIVGGSSSAGAVALRSRLTCVAFFVSGSTVAVALRSRFTGLSFLWTGTSGSSSEESGPRTSLHGRGGAGSDITTVDMVRMQSDPPSPHAFQITFTKVSMEVELSTSIVSVVRRGRYVLIGVPVGV